MKYTEQILEGFLIKRYKRFFADINIDNEVITAYCPNTGSLLGLNEPMNKVLVAKVENPKAKLKYRLEAIQNNNTFVGVNTSLPNNIIYEALLSKKIFPEINGAIKKEVKYGKNSRIDILIENENHNIYIEVKSVTLSRTKNIAEFPDAVTSRGSKHLIELSQMSKKGHQCLMIYLIQRSDVNQFKIAKDIDEKYYKNALIAKNSGVQFLAYSCKITKKGISLYKKIDIHEN
ncbi:MAG: DNA/RNA nuclease SfsA [Pelagibacteraceae bacterium]|jgi:sugar fermentation stimulation protein A